MNVLRKLQYKKTILLTCSNLKGNMKELRLFKDMNIAIITTGGSI
jgi:hypothetical protein